MRSGLHWNCQGWLPLFPDHRTQRPFWARHIPVQGFLRHFKIDRWIKEVSETLKPFLFMGWVTGLEPATTGATTQCSTNWATPTIYIRTYNTTSKDFSSYKIVLRVKLHWFTVHSSRFTVGKWIKIPLGRLSDNRHSGLDPESIDIPRWLKHWIPAFAGMTNTTIWAVVRQLLGPSLKKREANPHRSPFGKMEKRAKRLAVNCELQTANREPDNLNKKGNPLFDALENLSYTDEDSPQIPKTCGIWGSKKDALVKSRKSSFSVIPAKAGIQSFQPVTECLDSGFHRSDDFLRDYQHSNIPFFHMWGRKTIPQ